MYSIDINALKWGIGIYTFTIICWIIIAKKLLKSEPKSIKVNLSDRYIDLLDEDLKEFGIKVSEFKQMVYNNFVRISNAFMDCDYSVLKKYLTDDLYNYYVEQLELLKNKKQKNVLKDIELSNIKIYKVVNEHNMMIDVYLNVKMYDYIVDIDMNRLVKGKEEKIDYEFELTFIKKSGNQKEKEEFLLCKKSCINDMSLNETNKKNRER